MTESSYKCAFLIPVLLTCVSVAACFITSSRRKGTRWWWHFTNDWRTPKGNVLGNKETAASSFMEEFCEFVSTFWFWWWKPLPKCTSNREISWLPVAALEWPITNPSPVLLLLLLLFPPIIWYSNCPLSKYFIWSYMHGVGFVNTNVLGNRISNKDTLLLWSATNTYCDNVGWWHIADIEEA